MKYSKKKKKINTLIIAIIIIVGAIIISTVGLNYDLRHQKTKKIELYLGKKFETSDIREITNEVIPNTPVLIQKVEVYEDSVSIIAKEITEEQKQNLVNKINEKYGTEISVDETEIKIVPNTRGRDLVKPYILPFSIATIIILVYFCVRFIKIGSLKTLLKTIITLVVSQVVLLSIIAIFRIPVGRLTMPIVIIVYLLTLLLLTTKFEKQLKDKKEEETQGI